jgi:hypothetical protein
VLDWKEILPVVHSFQSAENLILFQKGLFSQVEETQVSLKENLRY